MSIFRNIKSFSRRIGIIFTCLICILVMFGCQNKPDNNINTNQNSTDTNKNNVESTKIKIGCMPLNKEALEALSEAVKKDGVDMEVVVFDGNNLPAMALAAHEIDGLILNHLPWIETFNEENKTDLTMVDGFSYASIYGLYSSKYKSIEEIPENATIVISNDPSNMERALLLLQDLNLIKLKDKEGSFYTTMDIAENPKNIKFSEVETTMTAGGYKDADAVISFSSVMKNAGYDAFSYLGEDGKSKDYPIGLVVSPEDKDSPWVEKIIKAGNTDEYKEKFDDIFQGAYVLLNK